MTPKITLSHEDPERFGWVAVAINGNWLLDKNGNRRLFKTTEAATNAAKRAAKQH